MEDPQLTAAIFCLNIRYKNRYTEKEKQNLARYLHTNMLYNYEQREVWDEVAAAQVWKEIHKPRTQQNCQGFKCTSSVQL
jgi:hypothetical protein